MTYNQCLETLTSLGHELRGVKFDLQAIRAILETLGHPERRYPTAIVGGTNGKGSTCAMLASILQTAGYRTGLYTSPHLVRANERIRVNGEEISDQDFARDFTAVWDCAERLLREKVLATRPSFFEFLTATAFVHFERARIGFAVLEVGMGGRLDATNVTEPRVTVITNVALDHQEFLGTTIPEIAYEKSGIITTGTPVITASEDPQAREVIRRRAEQVGVARFQAIWNADVSIHDPLDGRYEFDLALDGEFLGRFGSPLMGKFQVKNAVAAIAAARELRRQGWNINAEAIGEGLRKARWPGRLEVVSERPLAVLDGAHNTAAAREIAAFVRENWAGRRLILVYATMRDKAFGEITEILFPHAQKVYLTRPQQARAAAPEEILATAKDTRTEMVISPDPVQAFEAALGECTPEDIVLAAGSLFLVGEIKRHALLSSRTPEAPSVREAMTPLR
ncbi:MAG TPA: folylpolyglutamate synthase/dihydrofolate synthase family protein [Terriglobia bacterium]|nr:folylpolyglutamate synthase/dihydrofolate synthase family protein [Terriglobia bacterium]